MTTTRSHTDCTHPATKAGRAKCRRERAKVEAPALTVEALGASYYDGTGDLEKIAGGLAALGVDCTGYYNDTLTAEEFIASVKAPAAHCTTEDCTCAEADRTMTIILPRGPKVKVCPWAAEAHYLARLDRIDGNLAWQQKGGERTKRDHYRRKLAAAREAQG